MKTRVLMFGWEFPPHIAGGLGTACLGLTKGLAKQGVEVLFVMPKASGDEDQSSAKLLMQVMWKRCIILRILKSIGKTLTSWRSVLI